MASSQAKSVGGRIEVHHPVRQPTVVVIGASMAGLLAAAAAATAGAEVIVVERRNRPDGDAAIVPHGRFPHNLLAGGVRALETLLPGLIVELEAAGAQLAGPGTGFAWCNGRRLNRPGPPQVPLTRRSTIEAVVRRRVETDSRISILYGSRAHGLSSDRSRVAGVKLEERMLRADLVVAATGRAGRLDRWITAAGFVAPTTESQRIDVTYVAAFIADTGRGPSHHNWILIQNSPPRWPRIGLAIKVDPATWGVVVGGYHRDRPTGDIEGMTRFASSLPHDGVQRLLESADPSEPVHTHHIPSSDRRRITRRSTIPGLVVMGDALCSFNPVFGQGLSVAALQAVALGRRIAEGRVDDRAATWTIQRDLNRPADEAWLAATLVDGGYPQATGVARRPILRRYHNRLTLASTIDPVVGSQLDRVAALVSPARSLRSPTMIVRAFTAPRRRPSPGLPTRRPHEHRPKRMEIVP